ncbi:hypothetical protein BT69DRAFT_1347659 [Atractiella rhizophila]|nr:hypothetical protein BT69DRAFT_1347659 [Atractiella rhizophila]
MPRRKEPKATAADEPSQSTSQLPAEPDEFDYVSDDADDDMLEIDDEITMVPCQWGDCQEQFYEIESLITHVHELHCIPEVIDSSQKLKYQCLWNSCARRGKPQSSRFALVSHLRSHTGEKPYNCPRPECDKSFTRTDALQKHMKIHHNEGPLVVSNATPNKSRNTPRKGRGAVKDEDELEEGDVDMLPAEDESANVESEDERPSQEEMQAMSMHPDKSPYFIRYVIAKAKHRYALEHNESLKVELEQLNRKVHGLLAAKEECMDRILKAELGPVASDLYVDHGGVAGPPGPRT